MTYSVDYVVIVKSFCVYSMDNGVRRGCELNSSKNQELWRHDHHVASIVQLVSESSGHAQQKFSWELPDLPDTQIQKTVTNSVYRQQSSDKRPKKTYYSIFYPSPIPTEPTFMERLTNGLIDFGNDLERMVRDICR